MPEVFKSAASVFGLHRDGGRTDWYRIENKASGPTQVHIYDEIGMYGVRAAQFIADIAGVAGEIELHLNTPGGEVWDGISIYNALRSRQPTIIVDALAASIGSVIAMAAGPGKLFMQPTAKLMIHDGFTVTAGNAAELARVVERLNDASDTIASIYASRTGRPAAEWRDLMREETWYGADAAVAAGIADGIIGADGVSNRTPVLVNTLTDAAAPAPAQDDDMECVAWDPDGDGDDDSSPETDLNHSHWAADGTQLRPVPGKPMKRGSGSRSDSGEDAGEDLDNEFADFLIAALRDAAQPQAPGDTVAVPVITGIDTSPWNAAQAWHNAATSADPAQFYAGICAGRRPGDPSQQSSWALPYKYAPDSPPNAEAVAAALDKLPSLDGLVNTTEATVALRAADNVARVTAASAEYERAQAALDAARAAADAPVPQVSEFDVPYLPKARAVLPHADPFDVLLAAGVDNSEWNASKAWHAGANSADPAAFYNGICAGKRSGDPATQSAHALPYRYSPSSPPNAHGVKAALGRLSQTEGLTNADEAKAKLQGLMRKINPDYEPGDLAELFITMHQALTAPKEAQRCP